MKTIWKYEIMMSDYTVIFTPFGSTILTVKLQNNVPYVWMEVDTTKTDKERRVIRTVGTGYEINDKTKEYLGTLLMDNDTLVLHIYEVFNVSKKNLLTKVNSNDTIIISL